MAYRMQTSAPELIDLGRETQKTLELYGASPARRAFATNCLLARRLVERGVRFVQLYHTDWDSHGGPGDDLDSRSTGSARKSISPGGPGRDLKRRGLLDETLVVWGGEFGRTPMGETRETVGRNHHIDAFTMWMAGGGVKPGITLGASDELGFAASRTGSTSTTCRRRSCTCSVWTTQADVPFPGTRFPADRRAGDGGEEDPGVTRIKVESGSETGRPASASPRMTATASHKAERIPGPDGTVEWWDDPLSDADAVLRLPNRVSTLSSAAQRENRNKARELTVAAFGE